MSDKEYAKNQESIMEAMRTGKFVYDLSGLCKVKKVLTRHFFYI